MTLSRISEFAWRFYEYDSDVQAEIRTEYLELQA
jgi:hypothetical protein